MPLAQHSGTLGKKAAMHLLRRATFGPTKTEIDYFSGLTAAQALTELFQAIPEPAEPNDPTTGNWVNTAPDPMIDDSDRQQYIIQWWLGQMLNTNISPAQRMAFSTRERITFMLHTHFTTIQEVVSNSRSLYFQNVLFRKYAFDATAPAVFNIRDLAKKVSVDNAMLALLDGRLNVRGNPNENYARELFELYTIGKGLNGQYPATGIPGDYYYFTEQDIQAAALVLSGFDTDTDNFTNMDADTGLPRGIAKVNAMNEATQHDNTVKQFSARLGNATVTPNAALFINGEPSEASMLDEIDQLINIIFAQPETARNICRRIYRFYVYHDITATIETAVIDEMVNTLTTNNFKIEPVIQELLGSQHFYDSMDVTVDNDHFGALIKSPLDLVCHTLNFFEYQMPDYTTNPDSFHLKAENLVNKIEDQGMLLMNPYDVAGYEAYHQFPLFNRHWINTNALTQRYKFIFDTMTIDNRAANAVTVDLLNYYETNFATNALDPDLLVREVASYIFTLYDENTEITTERLDWFTVQFLKLGDVLNQAQPAFWQFSWNNRGSIPASALDARGMLQDKINAMMQSPEYQLF